jgi:hypothetical protein
MIAMCLWGETYGRPENLEGRQDRAKQNLAGVAIPVQSPERTTRGKLNLFS